MQRIPRVESVVAITPYRLRVRFVNGVEKVYDCRPVLGRPQFHLIENEAFFRAVRVDPGGYGISWNEDIDLSEYELWTNGQLVGEESLQPTP